MASATAFEVKPSMTISSTATVSGPSSDFTRPRSVGQKASLVEATVPLYLEPTLEPERTMPPGNGVMHVRHVGDGVDGGFRRLQQPGAVVAEDEQVAAADRVGGDAGRLLDDELAVHDGHAPEALLAEPLGGLEAVAEEARTLAEADALVGFDAGVAGRAGAGQHALADAVS